MSKRSLGAICILATFSLLNCARHISPKAGAVVKLQDKTDFICSQDFVTKYSAASEASQQNPTQPAAIDEMKTQCDTFTALNKSSCQIDCTKLSDTAKSDNCPKKNNLIITATSLIQYCKDFKAAH